MADETKEARPAAAPRAAAGEAATAGAAAGGAATGAPAAGAAAAPTPRRRRTRRSVPEGVAHVHATFNNTIIAITDPQGQVVAWASAGSAGVQGSRKETPFAAHIAAETAAPACSDIAMRMLLFNAS